MDEMHEIFFDEELGEIEQSLKNVGDRKEDIHQFLDDLQNSSYTGSSNTSTNIQKARQDLQVKNQEALTEIGNLTNEAIEERLQVEKMEEKEERNPYLKEEKKTIQISKIDLEKYKMQVTEFAYHSSVFIQEVVVPNVRKQLKFMKKNFATFAVTMGIAGGIGFSLGSGATSVVSSVIENYKENDLLEETLENYRLNVFEKNRSDVRYQANEKGYMQPLYEYNMQAMVTTLHEKYDGDAFVTWYFYYKTFMRYGEENTLNHKMTQILRTYNAFYNCNYISMEDFLDKNGFQNENELKEYVALQVEAWKERKSRGV